MKDESKQTVKNPVPRIDSFEIIDVDCTPFLTDEEKSWPVAALQPRIDSFEFCKPKTIESVEVDEATTLELTLFLSNEIVPNASENVFAPYPLPVNISVILFLLPTIISLYLNELVWTFP